MPGSLFQRPFFAFAVSGMWCLLALFFSPWLLHDRWPLRLLPRSAEAALAFPLAVLMIRDRIHVYAKSGLYRRPPEELRAGSAAWPPRFDGGLFRNLTRYLGAFWTLALVSWGVYRWQAGPHPLYESVGIMTSALVTVCAVSYCSSIGFSQKDASYPFSGFPLTNTFVGISLYVLLLWTLFASGPMRFALGGQKAAGVFVLLHLALAAVPVAPMYLAFRGRGWPSRINFALVIGALLVVIVVPQSLLVWSLEWPWPGPQPPPTALALAGLAWFLSITPILVWLPTTVVAFRAATRRSKRVRMLSADELRELAIEFMRGYFVLLTIVRRNLLVFGWSLPFSLFLSLEPLNAWAGRGLAPDLGLSVWLAASLLWLTPVINGLYYLDDTYVLTYAFSLHRALLRLRHHLLVLGYGDLGRRLVEQQIFNRIFPYNTLGENLMFSENVLLPDGRFAKLLTRFAAIEQNPQLLRGKTRTPDRKDIATADVSDAVARASRHDAGTPDSAMTEDVPGGADSESAAPGQAPAERRAGESRSEALLDYLIPAVLGDATLEENQNLARLEDAFFVACLIRGSGGLFLPDSSQRVFRRLQRLARIEGKTIPCAIVIHSSTYVPYLTARTLNGGLPAHYLLPEHLEGLGAANVLYSAYLKFKANRRQPPRILICGRGKRLFYLLDSFFKSLSRAECGEFAAQQQADPFLMVLGDNTVFKATSFERPDAETLVLPTVVTATSTRLDRLAAAGIALKWLRFSRFISRQPAGAFDDAEMVVPFIAQEACDYEVFRAVLQAVEPDVILVSDHDAHAELRALQSILNNISRWRSEPLSDPASKRDLPLVLISGETGSHHLKKNLQTALVFYASQWSRDAVDFRGRTFPTPGMYRSKASGEFRGDPLIDVLDEPSERLTGLIRAYLKAAPADRADDPSVLPVQLDICDGERPGVLGETLARLAGYRTVQDGAGGPAPSLRNSRVIARPNGQFYIKGFLLLGDEPSAAARDASVGGCSSGRDGHLSRLLVSCGVKYGRGGETHPLSAEVIPQAVRLVYGEQAANEHLERMRHAENDHVTDDWVHQTKQCCGMPHCPVEGFHKIVQSAREELQFQMIESRDDRRDHGLRMARRFHVMGAEVQPRSWPCGQARAWARIECDRGDQVGTFATALNAMVFRKMLPAESASTHLFNFDYLSDYECHDERFSISTLYGTFEQRNGHALRPVEIGRVVNRIVIKPITGDGQPDSKVWKQYTKNLTEFLEKAAATAYGWKHEDGSDLRGERYTIERKSMRSY